jgi:hypothetical protein
MKLQRFARPFLPLTALLLAAAFAEPTLAQDQEPTIFHTVRIQLRDTADAAEVERVLAMMRELGEKLDFVESFVVGPDLSDGYDIGATYVLHGYDEFRAYLYDPLHLEIDRAGLPLVANMESFDITDAADKAAAVRTIAEIHRNRINEVPGLAELLREMESYTSTGN